MSLSLAHDLRQVVFTRGPMTRISGLLPEDKDAVRRLLTVRNPKYLQIKRFSGWVPANVPEWVTGYADDGDDMLVTPGIASHVWAIIAGNPSFYARPQVIDTTIDTGVSIGLTYMPGQYRAKQLHFVTLMAERKQASGISPCGGGKTNMGIDLICRIDRPAVVLVHSQDLAKQWRQRFIDVTGYEPVVFGGKARKKRAFTADDKVIIATVQMLNHHPEALRALAEHRCVMLVDEMHHTPCSMFTGPISVLNCRWRYGLTATWARSDGLEPLMEWYVGPRTAEILREELEADGEVLRPTMIPYVTPYTDTYNPAKKGDHSDLMNRLYAHRERFLFVLGHIVTAMAREPARQHLVLCGSVAHTEQLGVAIKEMTGHDALVITGQLSEKERDRALELVRGGFVQCVVATTLADEALDMPTLTDAWLVTPNNASKAEQRAGRVCRPYPGKPKPRVHDFVDYHVARTVHGANGTYKMRIFVNQFLKRLKGFYRDAADFDNKAVREAIDGVSR